MDIDNEEEKQKKLYVTFRKNDEEKNLYDWCVKQSKIGGVANFFKMLALQEKQKQEREGK